MFATHQLENYIKTFDHLQDFYNPKSPSVNIVPISPSAETVASTPTREFKSISKMVSRQSRCKVELKDFRTYLDTHPNYHRTPKVFIPDCSCYEEIGAAASQMKITKFFSEPTQKTMQNYSIEAFLPKKQTQSAKRSDVLSSTLTTASTAAHAYNKTLASLESFCGKLKALDVSRNFPKHFFINSESSKLNCQVNEAQREKIKGKAHALSAAAKECAEKLKERVSNDAITIKDNPGEVSEFVIGKQHPSPVALLCKNIECEKMVEGKSKPKESFVSTEPSENILVVKHENEIQEKIQRSKSTENRCNPIMMRKPINLKEIVTRVKRYAKSPLCIGGRREAPIHKE